MDTSQKLLDRFPRIYRSHIKGQMFTLWKRSWTDLDTESETRSVLNMKHTKLCDGFFFFYKKLVFVKGLCQGHKSQVRWTYIEEKKNVTLMENIWNLIMFWISKPNEWIFMKIFPGVSLDTRNVWNIRRSEKSDSLFWLKRRQMLFCDILYLISANTSQQS